MITNRLLKLTLVFLVFAPIVFLLSGCRSSHHSVEERYVLVATNIKLPYWQAAANGLSRAASAFKVRAELVGPATFDPKAQKEEFQRAVAGKPSGILVSAADPELLRADIDAAIAAGIPVITVDSDAPGSKRLLFIGTNNYQVGFIGGQLAAKKLGGKGNVVVYTMPEQANLNERLRGYEEAFAPHPQLKITRTIDIHGDPRIAFDQTTAIIEKERGAFDAFICLEAIACAEVAEVLSRNHVTGKLVIAMDTDQRTLEWIEKGVIEATIAQKPYTMAYFGVKMLDDLHHHKLPTLDVSFARDPFSPLPAFVDTGSVLIDKNNLEDFRRSGAPASSSAP